jgi:putative transposase
MVRAGVVSHPTEWAFGGYNEIQSPRRKCVLIDYEKLADLSGCDSYATFQSLHKKLINDAIENDKNKREARWSKSIAVGEKQFVTEIKKKLDSKALGRKIQSLDDGFQLREEAMPYIDVFDVKNIDIAPKNGYKWDTFP